MSVIERFAKFSTFWHELNLALCFLSEPAKLKTWHLERLKIRFTDMCADNFLIQHTEPNYTNILSFSSDLCQPKLAFRGLCRQQSMWRHSSVIFQLNRRTHSHQQHYLWVRKTTAKLLVNINKKPNFSLKMFCFMYSLHKLYNAHLYRVCRIPTNHFCLRDSVLSVKRFYQIFCVMYWVFDREENQQRRR